MSNYKFDVQLLLEGSTTSAKTVSEHITKNFTGDCLMVVGDESLLKLHFHTNTPWEILAYCASLGNIYDIIVENMHRQANGLKG